MEPAVEMYGRLVM